MRYVFCNNWDGACQAEVCTCEDGDQIGDEALEVLAKARAIWAKEREGLMDEIKRLKIEAEGKRFDEKEAQHETTATCDAYPEACERCEGHDCEPDRMSEAEEIAALYPDAPRLRADIQSAIDRAVAEAESLIHLAGQLLQVSDPSIRTMESWEEDRLNFIRRLHARAAIQGNHPESPDSSAILGKRAEATEGSSYDIDERTASCVPLPAPRQTVGEVEALLSGITRIKISIEDSQRSGSTRIYRDGRIEDALKVARALLARKGE